MPDKELIRLEGVTKDYRMSEVGVQALRGVNFEIETGEFIVLLGPSGCGTTTTLNMIGGLDKPSHGSVLVHSTGISTRA